MAPRMAPRSPGMHSAGVRIVLRLWQINVVYHYAHTDAFFRRRNIVHQSSRLDVMSNLLAGAFFAALVFVNPPH